jgi:hypothetical protein
MVRIECQESDILNKNATLMKIDMILSNELPENKPFLSPYNNYAIFTN